MCTLTEILGNDTEKISMAPALRMTRSIKESLKFLSISLHCFFIEELKYFNLNVGYTL